MKSKTNIVSALTAILVLAGGCCTSKQSQLEHVAKDWCLTIGASQVIPVYPLTEDIQPGDVFLVQVPIGQQREVYKTKGFLPLDNHIARLNPEQYEQFYANSFLNGKTNPAPVLPYDWIRGGDGVAALTNAWRLAPHAAFPSYSFSVRRGQGLNLAVPISGVPVGLSLLNSEASDGTVSIRDAHTMGVDMISLYNELKGWAATNREFLTNYAAITGGATNFLRVVSRVYATGKMDVSLRDTSSQSGGLDVGAAKPVNLLFPNLPTGSTNASESTAQNYTNALGVLNSGLLAGLAKDAAGNFLPGGSLRITAAGSRTISLQETFVPPLVVGYLGFDCIIRNDGSLDEPIPTYANLNPEFQVQHAKVKKFNNTQKQQIVAYEKIAGDYNQAKAERQEKIQQLAWQLKLIPPSPDKAQWITNLGILVDGNDPVKLDKLETLLKQIQQLK